MALPHAQPNEPIDVRPLGPALSTAVSTSLVKSSQLQLMRLVLRAGERVPPHHVDGEITVHCLEGEIELGVDGQPIPLPAGSLMLVGAGVEHALHARADSSVLVTVVFLAR